MRSGTEGTGSRGEAKKEEDGEGMKTGMAGGNSCWLQRYLPIYTGQLCAVLRPVVLVSALPRRLAT